MCFSGAFLGVNVLLMAAVVCGQNGWEVTCTPTQICALKGSTVKIWCSYTYPTKYKGTEIAVNERFWFTKKDGEIYTDLETDQDYSQRVEYHCESNNNCSLKISNLIERDGRVYKFRFITNVTFGKYTGLPGVSLSVTVPQVQVNVKGLQDIYQSGIGLTCHTHCQLPRSVSYVWFKDGIIQAETKDFLLDSFNAPQKYWCAVKGYEHVPSPAVYAPQLPSLSVTPSGEILEGISVNLSCSSDANPRAKYTYFRVKGGQNVTAFELHSVQASDSGTYFCRAENYLGSMYSSIYLDVKYAPKACTVLINPSGKVVEGEPVDLTCMSDANPAADEYTWYKENGILPNGDRQVYHVQAVHSDDRGNYVCRSKNKYGQCKSSSVFLDVLYAPKIPSVSIAPSSEIMEGSSVTLTCTGDANPAASYTWFRKNEQKPLSLKQKLIFNSIKSSDSGYYNCTASNNRGKNTSLGVHVDVKHAPRFPSVSLSSSGKIVEGSIVTLICSSDANPAGSYTWYKEGEESPKAFGPNFTISNIQNKHSGIYSCKVQNKIGHHNSTLSVTVVAGSSKQAVSVITVFILLIIVFLLVYLMRKWRASTPSPKPEESPNNIEQPQRTLSESEDDVQYASVRFLKKKRDPVYENVKPAKAGKPNIEVEEEHVEYATVNFASSTFGQRTEGPEPGEDSAPLYSVINKIQRPKMNY